MSNILPIILPILGTILLTALASVLTRRKYGAEIRGMDAATDTIAVANLAMTLKHQQDYIEGLEARLDRSDREREALREAGDARAVRAEQAEQACRSTLNQVQIQMADMQHQLHLLQRNV